MRSGALVVLSLRLGPVELLIGIGGMTAIALLGWLLILTLRRRRATERASAGGDAASRARVTTEEQVTAALHRRTLRRAHLRLEEDPIVASIGLGAASETEPTDHSARRSTRRSPPT